MNYKKIFLLTTLLVSSLLCTYKSAWAAENVAILNNPSVEDVSSIGNYVLNTTGKPFFDNVVLFAANINGSSPDSAYLYYNEYFNTLLNTELGITAIRNLQALGIKVQIAYLGNHQNAGWSCNMSAAGAQSLANSMVSDMNKYGFDGINIDDEYSACSGNSEAFYNIVKSIKTNSAFKGKILTKNLWQDSKYFYDPYNVATYLDQGYQMNYNGSVSSLAPYVSYGMSMQQLFLGLSPDYNSAGTVAGISASVINAGYAGMMVWAPNSFFNQDQAVTYYTNIAQGEYGSNAQVEITGTQLNQELISSSYENNGIVYAGTEDGLFIFRNNVWNKYTTSNGLSSNYIQKVQVVNNIIYVIDGGNAQYSIDNGMSWKIIAKACSDCKFTSINTQGNTIYLGSDRTTYQQGKGYITQGAYISISTDGNKTWQSTLLDSSIKSIFSLEISGDNLYFIDKKASYKGMLNMSFIGLKLDSAGKFTTLFNESFWNSNPGFISEALNSLAIDKNNSNNIYVATPDGLAVSTNGGKEFILRGQSSGLVSANIYSVAKYNNNLYVGTDAGCFVSYDNGNSFVPFNSNDGYGSNVLDVFANQNDVLVGTNKGIGVYLE